MALAGSVYDTRGCAVIQRVHFILDLRWKANAMKLIASLQAAYGFAYFADFTDAGLSVAIFNINAGLGLDSLPV